MGTPRNIAHYRILRILGMGGMGEVYLAEDTRLERLVALKILPAEAVEDPERLAAFHQEARAVSALSHPNIIAIYEIGSDHGVEYMATEYVDGETLRERMRQREPSVREVVEIGIGVAEALVAAHEVGIVHRDIKPENVMVRRDGYVKVLDFGVAKLIGADEGGESGPLLGTVHYTAPERIVEKETDARSDVFSLGVVLFELIAGSPPYEGETREEVIAAITRGSRRPLPRRGGMVPASLELVIARCLERERSERYQSASHLLEDLKLVRRELDLGPTALRTTGELRARALGAGGGSAAPEARRRVRRGILVALGAVAVALSIATAAWVSATTQERRIYDSVAVLPFANEGDSETSEILAEGLTDSLIRELSRVRDLRVMARGSVDRYRTEPRDPRQIGRNLGVDAVLLGRLESRGGDVIAAVELVDVTTGDRIWADQYRRNEGGVLQLERDMAQEIADELRATLGRIGSRGTRDPRAHRLYLEGRYHWNKRTPAGFDRAIDLFRQAIDLDPSYAEAYAGLADVYNLLGSYGDRPPSDTFPRAKAAALRAIQLDPDSAEARTSLAYVLQNYDWNWIEAEREYRKAIELSPSYAVAHHWYGGFLMLMGRFDEAIEHRHHAVELDPLSPQIHAGLGSPYFLSRRYDQAIALYRKAIEMDPQYARGHFALGWAYLNKGDLESGLRHIEIARRLSGSSLEARCDLAFAYAKAGRTEQARRIVADLLEEARRRYVDPYEFARIWSALGEKERALDAVEAAYRVRSNLLTGVKFDPSMDPLRDEPRFQAVLEKMRLR